MRLLKRCALTTVLVLASVFGEGCTMDETTVSEETIQSIYIEQGDTPGRLLYEYGEIGDHILPHRMLVGEDGSLYFLERHLQRIQQFNADGNFVALYELSVSQLSGREETEEVDESAELQLWDIFFARDGLLASLVSWFDAGEERVRWSVAKFQPDGTMAEQIFVNDMPEDIDQIDAAFCDEQGYIWCLYDKWLIFDEQGNFHSSVPDYGVFVDRRGYLYTDHSPSKVYDHHGAQQGQLRSETEVSADQVIFVDDSGLLVSRTRGLQDERTDVQLKLQNQLRLFRLNRETWTTEYLADLPLPETVYEYPHPRIGLRQSQRSVPRVCRVSARWLPLPTCLFG